MDSNTLAFFKILNDNQKNNWSRAIDSSNIFVWIEDLFRILFPEHAIEIQDIEKLWLDSKSHFTAILSKIESEKSIVESEKIASNLYSQIPVIYKNLQKDAQELLISDPASDCIQEIINTYPGFTAIAFYRIANAISKQKIKLLPRILTEYAHSKTGIDIHPDATIGVPFVIDHGTGIVIGETAFIGKYVHIYQGVTLGALQVDKSMEQKKRHPTVEDRVVIYANATILGGSTIIGNNSVIGGNTFVTKSVNPYSFVIQSSKNTILNPYENNDANTFNI